MLKINSCHTSKDSKINKDNIVHKNGSRKEAKLFKIYIKTPVIVKYNSKTEATL